MGVVEFLNTISFYKDKQEWEHEMIKANASKQK